MQRLWRSIAVIVGLGSTMGGLMPGCSNRLGPVTATQRAGMEQLDVPGMTLERLQECVAENGAQLEPRMHQFNATLELDEDGYSRGVTLDGIPETADNLGSCMRSALGDMSIPRKLVLRGAEQLHLQREQALAEQRNMIGMPLVIVVAGVTIVVTEVMLEAGAITILLATTVKVVEKAVDDVTELAKRRRDRPWDECLNRYEACVAGKLYRDQGRHIGDSRCGLCVIICRKTKKWPEFVDLGPCN